MFDRLIKYSNPKISPLKPIVELDGKRVELTKLFGKLKMKRGAEIGVLHGDFTKIICDNNPSLEKIYGVDSWTKKYGYNDGKKSEAVISKRYYDTRKLLTGYPVELMRMESMVAVRQFEKDSLDFVYIDANHDFDSVMEDIIEWAKIVKDGGIVSGHDYVKGNMSHTIKFGVIEAVDTYLQGHQISPLYLYTGERSMSWFFINDKSRYKYT